MEYPDTRGCGLGCFYSVCPLPEAPTASPLCDAGVLEHIVHGAVAHTLERLVGAAADVEGGDEIVQMDERIIAHRRLVREHVARRSADLPRCERDVEIVLVDDAAARGVDSSSSGFAAANTDALMRSRVASQSVMLTFTKSERRKSSGRVSTCS